MPTRKRSRAPERGQKLTQARKRAGLTQEQLAEDLGVSRVSIARIETGSRSPSMALALRIADRLGESLDELFAGGER
jgi:putative transcriptional regulator